MSTNTQLPPALRRVSSANRLKASFTRNSRIAFIFILILLFAVATVGVLLVVLGNLELQARAAFAGQTDSNTWNLRQGVAWIFANIQRLATLDVKPYSSH